MVDREVRSPNPTVAIVVTVGMWVGVGALVSAALPPTPSSYATWVKVVLGVAWFAIALSVGYLIRRHLSKERVVR